MATATRPLIRFVVIVFAIQLASWLSFFLLPQSKRLGVSVGAISIQFISIAFVIYVIVKLVQWRAPAWLLIGALILCASSMIYSFSISYWDIGTKANFSVELTRFDAVYFAVGTLSGGTGSIIATDVVSRSLQTFQTIFNLAFTLFAVGLVVTRMADAIPSAARRRDGNAVESADSAGTVKDVGNDDNDPGPGD
jgi:hypothetical protein